MINLSMPDDATLMRPRISVIGVGGAGGNAVNNMIRSNLEGVEFVVTNTDAQALQQSLAERRIQLGSTVTRGLGAGARPDVGRAAAEESLDEILDHVADSNMVFITAGMGGGTGTGAAPAIARATRERGILTVGVVTKPFHFEGAHRMRLAEYGIQELQQFVDTLIIIPNQNLFRIANEKTTFADAFKMADDVLHSGVRGVTDLMIMPGLINLDFADIRTVMAEMGKAMMGTGEATGERRALDAAEAAISNPLLDDVSMKGARGVLINITGGYDMTLFEVDEAANRIRDEVDADANIIFGSTFDETMDGRMRVSVVATGIDAAAAAAGRPNAFSVGAALGARRPVTGGAPAQAAAPVATPFAQPARAAVQAPEPAATEAEEPEAVEAEPAAATDARGYAPRAEARPDAFIPPQPVPSPIRATPAADASRNVRPSLFARVTGQAKRFVEGAPAQPQPTPAASPQPDRAQPQFTAAQPTATVTPAQPRLPHAPRAAHADEDVLDIPAFLRRQAN